MSNKDNTLKARLLKGTLATEPVYVPAFEGDGCGGYLADGEVNEECDGVVRVRPLSDGEQGEVDAAKTKGITVRGAPGQKAREQEVDASVAVGGERAGRRLTVAYGLSVDGVRWSASEVAKLPPVAVRTLAAKIEELSGGSDPAEAVREFRGDAGGPDDGGPALDGDATSDDAG